MKEDGVMLSCTTLYHAKMNLYPTCIWHSSHPENIGLLCMLQEHLVCITKSLALQNIMKVRKSLKKTLQQFAFGNVMRPHVEASFVTPCMSYFSGFWSILKTVKNLKGLQLSFYQSVPIFRSLVVHRVTCQIGIRPLDLAHPNHASFL